jgi:hypothetical protein
MLPLIHQRVTKDQLRAVTAIHDLARIIHDGSSAPHPSLPHNMGEGEGGGPRRARGAGRKGGILEQDVNRPSGEPARLGAVKHAPKLVAVANPRLQ